MEKLKEQLAKNITQYFELEEQSAELLKDDHTTVDFLDILVSQKLYSDAINLLSHSLPNREAVWWACICAKPISDDDLSKDTLLAAEKWVYEPTEKNRRLAEFYAEKGKFGSAASWVAAAAFWSGDNIVGEQDPKIAPGEYLYAHAVSGSIMTSVCLQDDISQSDLFEKYISHGLNIANGGNG